MLKEPEKFSLRNKGRKALLIVMTVLRAISGPASYLPFFNVIKKWMPNFNRSAGQQVQIYTR
jgi:hypothetical protein